MSKLELHVEHDVPLYEAQFGMDDTQEEPDWMSFPGLQVEDLKDIQVWLCPRDNQYLLKL